MARVDGCNFLRRCSEWVAARTYLETPRERCKFITLRPLVRPRCSRASLRASGLQGGPCIRTTSLPRRMGKQRMDQNWQRVKSQINAVWGEIDEQELKKARGSLPKMVSLIHEKTGEDRDVIFQKMSAVI
jgi:uncharacterized protein YjbJ (UPF0337 family)